MPCVTYTTFCLRAKQSTLELELLSHLILSHHPIGQIERADEEFIQADREDKQRCGQEKHIGDLNEGDQNQRACISALKNDRNGFESFEGAHAKRQSRRQKQGEYGDERQVTTFFDESFLGPSLEFGAAIHNESPSVQSTLRTWKNL